MSYNIIALDELGNIVEVAGKDFPCQHRAIGAAKDCRRFYGIDRRVNELAVWNTTAGGPIARFCMRQWRAESEEYRYMVSA